MAVQVLFCFTAFLAIFVSLESAFALPSNVKNATDLETGKVIVKGNYNAVNLYPEKDLKTVLSQLQKKLESLEGRMEALEKFKSGIGCLMMYFNVSIAFRIMRQNFKTVFLICVVSKAVSHSVHRSVDCNLLKFLSNRI